jgi:amino acid transporter
VNRHELDVFSLLAGVVFLVLGGVGLLQGAGVVGSGAPWAVIGAVAAVGLAGIVVSLRRLATSDRAEPVAEPVAEPTVEQPEEEVSLDRE